MVKESEIMKETFRASDIVVRKTTTPKPKPTPEEMVFGHVYSDHMFMVAHEDGKWGTPEIVPFAPIPMHPGSHVMHYGTSCFEGMKAFASEDGPIRLFRPERNMARIYRSSQRICCAEFDPKELLKCIEALLRVDADWVPRKPGYSCYMRPFVYDDTPVLGLSPASRTVVCVVLCPCGPYFKTGLNPVSLFLDEVNVRAWPGGAGDCKLGSNYAPTILPSRQAAREHGCAMPLFLLPQGRDPEDALVSECGAMNVFFLIANEDGKETLVTPPLDGTILPGVTRDTCLDLCREWGEFEVRERPIALKELLAAQSEGRLRAMWGCGTAAVVVPIDTLKRADGSVISSAFDPSDEGHIINRITKTITDIQYGRIPSDWSVPIEGTKPKQ